MFLISKLIPCFIDGYTSGKKNPKQLYIHEFGSEHIHTCVCVYIYKYRILDLENEVH